MGGACSTHGKHEKCTQVFFGKPEGKRPTGRHRRRWEDNSRTVLTEIGWEGVDWMHVAQDRDR